MSTTAATSTGSPRLDAVPTGSSVVTAAGTLWVPDTGTLLAEVSPGATNGLLGTGTARFAVPPAGSGGNEGRTSLAAFFLRFLCFALVDAVGLLDALAVGEVVGETVALADGLGLAAATVIVLLPDRIPLIASTVTVEVTV
jgi:hypothetical protein